MDQEFCLLASPAASTNPPENDPQTQGCPPSMASQTMTIESLFATQPLTQQSAVAAPLSLHLHDDKHFSFPESQLLATQPNTQVGNEFSLTYASHYDAKYCMSQRMIHYDGGNDQDVLITQPITQQCHISEKMTSPHLCVREQFTSKQPINFY